MKIVYKSNIAIWLLILLLVILLIHFFPDIVSYRRFNFGETYISNDKSISPIIFTGVLGVIFLGALCKTVLETEEGFEIHYMYGLQKKWFGKDFLIFTFVEESLLTPNFPYIASNTHIKFWDGSKTAFIYPTGTRNFDKLNERLNELAVEYRNKKMKDKKEVLTEDAVNKPEVQIIHDFISKSFQLFHLLKDSVNWDTRMKARKTASFGVSYDYSGISYPQTEMLEEIVPLCEKIESEFGFRPNNCLMNYYEDGNSSLGYHSDSSEELEEGTGVAIISLGAERTINYKNKDDQELIVPYKLKSGTLLFMNKKVQDEWLHAIPKMDEAGTRISLTFRKIVK